MVGSAVFFLVYNSNTTTTTPGLPIQFFLVTSIPLACSFLLLFRETCSNTQLLIENWSSQKLTLTMALVGKKFAFYVIFLRQERLEARVQYTGSNERNEEQEGKQS